MNEIANEFLLAGDKFIPEMHLRQPGFSYSAYGPSTRNKQRTQKFMETEDYIYKIISTKMNWIELVFSMMWLMEILKT